MEIPVLVEPLGEHGFRATCGAPWGIVSNAPTRDQAIAKLRLLIGDRLKAGAEVVELEIGERPHPLAEFAGHLKGDPMLDEFKEAIAEYRRETEARLQAE